MSFSMRLSEQVEVAGSVAVNLEWARQNFSLIVYGIIIVSVLPVAIEVLRARMGKHKG